MRLTLLLPKRSQELDKRSGHPHIQKFNPIAGDLSTQLAGGRVGIIKRVLGIIRISLS